MFKFTLTCAFDASVHFLPKINFNVRGTFSITYFYLSSMLVSGSYAFTKAIFILGHFYLFKKNNGFAYEYVCYICLMINGGILS